MKRLLQFLPFLVPFLLPAQRLTVVLDPARGGTEYGARLGENVYEKQVTLDLAGRLRSLLAARDFDVVFTRDSDVLVSNDQRAGIANQSRAVACISLHGTKSGTGVHLFTSAMAATAPSTTGTPWDEAQGAFVQRSQRLREELASAFSRAHIPVSSGRTWIRPLDNMQCPAVAIEIAPDGKTSPSDHDYQSRIADAIANSLLIWRGHADIVQSIVAPAPIKVTAPSPSQPNASAEKTSFAGKPETSPSQAARGASGGPARKPAAPLKTAQPANSDEGGNKPE